MNTCDTCKFWMRGYTLGPVCAGARITTTSDGELKVGLVMMSEHGPRPILDVSLLGNCREFAEYRYDSPQPDQLDRLFHQGPSQDNQWGSGGISAPRTGPKFGCIHWSSK